VAVAPSPPLSRRSIASWTASCARRRAFCDSASAAVPGCVLDIAVTPRGRPGLAGRPAELEPRYPVESSPVRPLRCTGPALTARRGTASGGLRNAGVRLGMRPGTPDYGQRLTPAAGRRPALDQVPLRLLRMSTKRRMMIRWYPTLSATVRPCGKFCWTTKHFCIAAGARNLVRAAYAQLPLTQWQRTSCPLPSRPLARAAAATRTRVDDSGALFRHAIHRGGQTRADPPGRDAA
jgi:hypothetical protein